MPVRAARTAVVETISAAEANVHAEQYASRSLTHSLQISTAPRERTLPTAVPITIDMSSAIPMLHVGKEEALQFADWPSLMSAVATELL